ncbi:low affinity iron permease family protein [Rhizobium calliandrae]|uniref:Low affinity iron permease family protein n=1 Tax=Rhizobium calliandrae TaxID=1312182 RepID=A0ABT7KAS5_9HYPH|nr:low affinity iron permease family protein [Rhizobium calliandrae]MDL2405718.1 low affinity iron permease family protein [Rhizobium calliandrae]
MAELRHIFSRFAAIVSEWTGKPAVFILALLSVIVWGTTGPIFDYSENWQLVINTGTTIVTFLMVFLLQNSQTRDTRAIQAKLNELILTSAAENRFIGIENLDEEDLKHLDRLVAKAAKRGGNKSARSIEEDETVGKPRVKQKGRRIAGAAPSDVDQ